MLSIFILSLFLLFFSPQETNLAEIGEKSYLRSLQNSSFGIGEKLQYDLKYGFLDAGTAKLDVVEILPFNGRDCYKITSEMKTNKTFSRFFKVDDFVFSYIDVKGIFLWYHEKHVHEGNYISDKIVTFDYENGLVYENSDTLEVTPFTQDVLSIFYYLRILDFKVGDSFDIQNYADGKHYPLNVQISKQENVKVPAGEYRCLKVEPIYTGDKKYKPKGQLTMWLSNDNHKLPVKIKSKIAVGSIIMELRQTSGLLVD